MQEVKWGENHRGWEEGREDGRARRYVSKDAEGQEGGMGRGEGGGV